MCYIRQKWMLRGNKIQEGSVRESVRGWSHIWVEVAKEGLSEKKFG